MYEAHLQYGYTLKDIAEYIGVHYTTVRAERLKELRGKMKSDIARPDPIISEYILKKYFSADKKLLTKKNNYEKMLGKH
jgi:hypothetical protein